MPSPLTRQIRNQIESLLQRIGRFECEEGSPVRELLDEAAAGIWIARRKMADVAAIETRTEKTERDNRGSGRKPK